MKVRECRALVKAANEGDAEGTFSALVSVFGNEDSYGDVVMPGAFADTLAEWKGSGNPIPVIWSHDWSDPFSHIGAVTDAEETDRGLEVTGVLDLEGNAKAQQVYRLLKSGRVTQFSFAFDVTDGGFETHEGEDVYAIRGVKLYEVGPTLIGANQETELLAVKAAATAAAVKSGHELTDDNMRHLIEAANALTDALKSVTESSAAPVAESPEEQPGQPPAEPNESGSQADSSARPKRLSPAVVRASVISAPELNEE